MDNKYITFEDFLKNELTPEESKEFLLSLEQNPVLEKDFRGYKMMRENLIKKFNVKTDKDLLEHLEKFGDTYFTGRDEEKKKKGGTSFRPFRLVLSMAASLLILFGMLWGFKMQVQDTHSTNLLVENSKVAVVDKSRGSVDEEESTDPVAISNNYLLQLNELYLESDYVELLGMNDFEILLESDKIKAEIILAESYIQLSEFDKSIELCESLLAQTTGELASKVAFVKARAYIAKGEKKRGIESLEQISNGDTGMKRPATELLKELNSFKHWLASF